MKNTFIENLLLISILVYLLLSIANLAKADSNFYLLAKYTPVGSTSWEWKGGQDWVYKKTDAQVGLGFVNKFSEHLSLSTRQYVVLDGTVGATGVTGNLTAVLGGHISIKYEYNYRWYDGSEGDYGYATGGGLTNKLILDIVMPIL